MVGNMATQTSFLLDLAFQSTRQMESALEMTKTEKKTDATSTTGTGRGSGLEAGLEGGLGAGLGGGLGKGSASTYDQMYSFFSSATSSQRNDAPLHHSTAAAAAAAVASTTAGTFIQYSSSGLVNDRVPINRTPPSSSTSSIQGSVQESVQGSVQGSGDSVFSDTDGSLNYSPDRDEINRCPFCCFYSILLLMLTLLFLLHPTPNAYSRSYLHSNPHSNLLSNPNSNPNSNTNPCNLIYIYQRLLNDHHLKLLQEKARRRVVAVTSPATQKDQRKWGRLPVFLFIFVNIINTGKSPQP